MAEILSTFGTSLEAVTNLNKYVLTPIMNQFGYLCFYNSNVQSLRDQVEKLNKRRSDLQLEVDRAERNTEVIRSDVEEWIEDVFKINEKKERIIQDTAQVQQGCFYGTCPNIKLRYSLSREAKKTADAAQALLQQVSKFSKISHPAPVEPIPAASAGIEVNSRKSKEDEIMEDLKDDMVYVIALCGMGGVGKTTTAKKIESKVRERKIFEEVVMTVVSRSVDLKNVQEGIAEGLGLKLDEQTIPARAKRLHRRLKETESVLIILDDVWEKFNLQEIGIPSKTTHQRCKILLTSRVQHVCRNIEDSAKIIQLDVLSEQEAWNLFKEKAGEIVDEPNLYPIAMDVARECKGLPLALVTVAAALRNSSIPAWEDALCQLKASMAIDIPEVHKEVYVPLKWSYKQLQNKEARYLFLFCCLFPEDYEIGLHLLVEYGFALRIFKNTDNLEKARNRVYRLVEMLIDHFLLIRVDLMGNNSTKDHYMNYRVKMHDVIRDMAISIASKDKHGFMVIHDNDLREWPKKNSYDNYACISLSSRNIIALPEKIYCRRLELLRLNSSFELEIQESSFDGMRGLKVLDTCPIKSLPSSLLLLTNLQMLFLVRCKLKILPNEIGDLVNLEILSLCNSHVVMLPKEIKRLKNLKLLDLTNCWRLKNIPPGVISGLVRLEELFMLGSFDKWKVIEDTNASIAEVATLTKLTTLQIQADRSSMNLLRDSRNWHKLTRYCVVIGKMHVRDSGNFDKCIKLRLFELDPLTHLVEELFENAQDIELAGEGSTDMANKLSIHGYKNVERLVLRYQALEFLFDSSSWNLPNTVFLPHLTTLVLESNDALKEICHGQPPTGSFSNLTSVKLEFCNGLKNLFSFSMVAMLSKLEFLEIEHCKIIKAVFFEQNRKCRDSAIITFPRLSKLRLNSLPSLGAFCEAIDHVAIEFPRLYEMDIGSCSRLKSFCTTESSNPPEFFLDQKVICGGLKRISLDYCKIRIFHPRIPIDNFIGIESIRFRECSGCVNLFSNSMSRGMHNLKDLYMTDMEMLQEAIAKDEEEQTSSMVTLFPQLKVLQLWSLPKMQQFCHSSHGVELPSLEVLIIGSCHLMEMFSRNQINSPSDSNYIVSSLLNEVTCIKLKELYLSFLHAVTVLFGPTITSDNFNRLRRVKIDSCDRLKSIFSPSMFRGLINLQVLRVIRCPVLEAVFPEGEKEPQFPQLKELGLCSLPKIIGFCHGKDGLDLPLLEILTIKNCSRLKSFCTMGTSNLPGGSCHNAEQQFFFHPKVTCSKLKQLKLKNVEGATKLFGHKISTGNFSGLETLDICCCKRLRSIFSPGMFRGLVNLQQLTIESCPMLQEVISEDVTEGETVTIEKTLFPQLKNLELSNLPKLIRFCHIKNDIDLPSLELAVFSGCPMLETFSFGSVHLPSSVRIYTRYLGSVKGLSEENFASHFFNIKRVTNNER